jgi:hypothetical protein
MTGENNARYFDDFIAADGCKEMNAGTRRLDYAVAVNKSDQLNAGIARRGNDGRYFDDLHLSNGCNEVNAGTCRLNYAVEKIESTKMQQ